MMIKLRIIKFFHGFLNWVFTTYFFAIITNYNNIIEALIVIIIIKIKTVAIILAITIDFIN